MVWTERQAAMLRAIGVRLWQPEPADPVASEPAHAERRVAEPQPAGEAPATAAPALVARADAAAGASRPAPARAVAAEATAADAAASVGGPPPRPAPRRAPPPSAVAASTAATGRAGEEVARGAGLDWAELRAAVDACDACTLAGSRTRTVFGVGHPHAHWMVIGEAPGEQEDERGEPFVGPAGQLLDAMLRALALTREADGPPERRAYIANTLKCRPPRNRNPAPDELQRCEGFLVRQIELVQPRIILAMGRFALQALLRSDEPVGRLRGRVHRYQGVPLIVTYHPAYLLRNPADKARAWEDLCLAAAVAERGDAG